MRGEEQLRHEVWVSLPAALKKQSVLCDVVCYSEPVSLWEITEMPYLQQTYCLPRRVNHYWDGNRHRINMRKTTLLIVQTKHQALG